MITSVPPATWRILPPTDTDPPTPTPMTIHPTWALAVCPSLTVTVLEGVTGVGITTERFRVIVELALAVVVAGDDFGVFVDVGLDAREVGDFGFCWLVVPIIGVFGVLVTVDGVVG